MQTLCGQFKKLVVSGIAASVPPNTVRRKKLGKQLATENLVHIGDYGSEDIEKTPAKAL
jgi:hypothetical protein